MFPPTTKSDPFLDSPKVMSNIAFHASLRKLIPSDYHVLLHDFLEIGSQRRLELIRSVPRRTLAVSLTGRSCSLHCAHCGGHYLNGMKPFSDLSEGDIADIDSLLISGGSDAHGAVPIKDHLARLLSLPERIRLNLHLGFQELGPIETLLHRPGVTVSCDLIGDRETIQETFGLPHTPDDYFDLFTAASSLVPTVPHITVGLRGGRLSGEEALIERLCRRPPPSLTFLAFRPTPKTRFESSLPPAPDVAAGVVATAAKSFPSESRIHIGCMRPAGTWRTVFDTLSWAAGARTIVMPSKELVECLVMAGIPLRETPECCSL